MELFAFILVCFLAREFLQIFVTSGKNTRKYDLIYCKIMVLGGPDYAYGLHQSILYTPI